MGNSLTVQPQINLNNQTRDATHVFVHPSYDSKSMMHDVAVIRVRSGFELDFLIVISMLYLGVATIHIYKHILYCCA